MTGGRTTWWSKDAAWHRRELVVELGDEFGADGPFLLDVLSSWAQEQRDAGLVRGGFRTLAREAFVTVSHAQSILSRAHEIGALDDLEFDPDGRRFTCRVSGWKADQERGRAALRQAAKRNQPEDSDEQTVTDRDTSQDVTLPTPPDLTKEREEREDARENSPLTETVTATVRVLAQCERLHVVRLGVENAIGAWPNRDPIRAAQTVVTWASDPAFRSTNGAALLVKALEKQTNTVVSHPSARRGREDAWSTENILAAGAAIEAEERR